MTSQWSSNSPSSVVDKLSVNQVRLLRVWGGGGLYDIFSKTINIQSPGEQFNIMCYLNAIPRVCLVKILEFPYDFEKEVHKVRSFHYLRFIN